MSYSLYVPLRRIPQHIEEVREIVQTFLSCNEETLIKYHFDNKPKAIISTVVHIKYKNGEQRVRLWVRNYSHEFKSVITNSFSIFFL